MGAQNRNHISNMSRFRVMGQKGDSKKGPKSQITRQKGFSVTSEWYQSIGLKILHHMSASKKSTRILKPQSKNTNTLSVSTCPGVTSQ